MPTYLGWPPSGPVLGGSNITGASQWYTVPLALDVEGLKDLLQMLLELGKYLEEKSFSPDVTFRVETKACVLGAQCPCPVVKFQVPNIEKEYGKKIIFPGVRRWCIQYNRFVPKNVVRRWGKTGIEVTARLTDKEYKIISDRLNPYSTFALVSFQNVLNNLNINQDSFSPGSNANSQFIYGPNTHILTNSPSPAVGTGIQVPTVTPLITSNDTTAVITTGQTFDINW